LCEQMQGNGDRLLWSGQNTDTMLYVDHYHAPTQLIMHERVGSVISGLSRRWQLWGRFNEGALIENQKFMSEHVWKQNSRQSEITTKYASALCEEFRPLELPNVTGLKKLKLLRWFRGSASVNDNFEVLRKQTGIERLAVLNNPRFLNMAIAFQPRLQNYLYAKHELVKLLRQHTGINHRRIVTGAVLSAIDSLAKTRKSRQNEQAAFSEFNYQIVKELFEKRKRTVSDLVKEVGDSILTEFYISLSRQKDFTNSDLKILHRLINLDIFLENARK